MRSTASGSGSRTGSRSPRASRCTGRASPTDPCSTSWLPSSGWRSRSRGRAAGGVARVLVEGGRARGVITDAGERIDADAVVLTTDLPVAWRELLGTYPRRVARQRYSPSCFLLLAGSRATYPEQAHHTIHFGHAWKQ